MRWKGVIPAGLPAMILLLAPACAADPLEDCKSKCQDVYNGVKDFVDKYNDVLNEYGKLEGKFKEFKGKYEQCKEQCKEVNIDTSILDLMIDDIERDIHSIKNRLEVQKKNVESALSMLQYTSAKLEDICKATQGNEKLRAQILNGFDGLLVIENGQLTVKSYGHGLLSVHRRLCEMLNLLNSSGLQSALNDAKKVIQDAISILDGAINFLGQQGGQQQGGGQQGGQQQGGQQQGQQQQGGQQQGGQQGQQGQGQQEASELRTKLYELRGKLRDLQYKLATLENKLATLEDTASTLCNSAYDVAQLVTAAWIRTKELKEKERKKERKEAPATWGLLALGCLTLARRLQRRGRR